jgi:integrase
VLPGDQTAGGRRDGKPGGLAAQHILAVHRNGELCGLEWADPDLDGGTVRFRQALTVIDPAVLPNAAAVLPDDDAAGGGDGAGGGECRRKELAVGPLKSAASSAILALPPFAVQALRRHRHQQLRLRLAVGSPPRGCAGWSLAAHPARSSWTWCS